MSAPEYRPLKALSGVVRHVDHPFWEEVMEVAIFKPIKLAEKAGVEVWGKLVQIVVHRDDVEQHVADGWHTDAAKALEAADSPADEPAKVDGRSKEARAAKAAQTGDGS